MCIHILTFQMHPSGVLFCVGGRGGSGDPFRSIECYSVTKNSWFFGPEMNSRRRHVGVISVGGEEGDDYSPMSLIPVQHHHRCRKRADDVYSRDTFLKKGTKDNFKK